MLTKGGKQEKIKKPRREGEKQTSFIVNLLVQVIWKTLIIQLHWQISITTFSVHYVVCNSYLCFSISHLQQKKNLSKGAPLATMTGTRGTTEALDGKWDFGFWGNPILPTAWNCADALINSKLWVACPAMILYLSKYIRNFDDLCFKFCALGTGKMLIVRFTFVLVCTSYNRWTRCCFSFPESGENRFKSNMSHQYTAVHANQNGSVFQNYPRGPCPLTLDDVIGNKQTCVKIQSLFP